MDLMCNEKEMFKDHHQVDNHMQHMMHVEPQVNTASADPTFLSERCLENLLKSEETHPVLNFYNNPQCEITPKMRRIVAEWMMELLLIKRINIRSNMQHFYRFDKRLHTTNASQEVMKRDAERLRCAKAWSTWEMATSQLQVNPENLLRAENDTWALAFARIECHFFVNKGFMKPNQLIDNAHIIRNAKIPVTIVQGRYDVVCPAKTALDLYKQLSQAEFFFIDDAGHSAKEAGTTKKLVEACDKYKTLNSKN